MLLQMLICFYFILFFINIYWILLILLILRSLCSCTLVLILFYLPCLQADSPDAKDELACLESEHQDTLREVS